MKHGQKCDVRIGNIDLRDGLVQCTGDRDGIVVEEQQEISAGMLDGPAARRTGSRIALARITKGKGKLAAPAECFRGIGGSIVYDDDFKIVRGKCLLGQGFET